jgi:segregation and condensation protein A
VLQRFNKRDDARDIFEDKWTVSEKIEHLVRLISDRPTVRFSELFESASSRSEAICTFLALLELIRLKQLVCAQGEAFSEIEISKAAGPGLATPALEPAAVTASAQPESSPS